LEEAKGVLRSFCS